MEPLRKKWEVAKKTRLEYYAANINPECWIPYKARRPIDHVQHYLIIKMSNNSRRAPTLVCTRGRANRGWTN